jgi:PhnB protein
MPTEQGRPEGANWLTPYITVADADAALGFYQRAFGFEPGLAMPGADGRTAHASMTYQGATLLMFAPEGAWGDSGMHTPAHSGAEPPLDFYVYCPDVDALTARARGAGAEVLAEPEQMFWGDRMVRLRDPDGYLWSFATNVGPFDPSKAPG